MIKTFDEFKDELTSIPKSMKKLHSFQKKLMTLN